MTHAAEKRMALEALRAELNSGKNSAVDRIAALEEEVSANPGGCQEPKKGQSVPSPLISFCVGSSQGRGPGGGGE